MMAHKSKAAKAQSMLASMLHAASKIRTHPLCEEEGLHKKEHYYAAASTAIGIATDAVTSVPTATPHLT